MKGIPNGPSVSVVITDPPYNVGLGTKSQNFSKRQAGYSNVDDSLSSHTYNQWIGKLQHRIMEITHAMIITPGNTNQTLWSPPTWTMAWTKANGCTRTPLTHGQKMMHSCWEPILTYGRFPNPPKSDVINVPISIQSEADGHPCPKPLKLIRQLVSMCAEDALILDPCCGSGTTCIAAKQLGRKYIGIEIDPIYCKIAEDRLRQGELFATERRGR